ncbi:MAG: HEAT repeat domain-containing protein [Acidobacteriota bacterium]
MSPPRVRAPRALVLLTVLVPACASAPPAVEERAPTVTFEQKMAWILQLEQDRVLEAPAPVAALPPAMAVGGTRVTARPPAAPRPSLLSLLSDDEARVRRRAALAVGRTRMPAGVTALQHVLANDADAEVRQMAAFAMGLIGDSTAAPALLEALKDPDPVVHGRAAEALGLLGHKAAATPIAAMIDGHIKSGTLTSIAPDDLEHPKAPPVEAVRLGIYALVRLGSYEALAAALTDGSGRPVSHWWPIGYAFRRIARTEAAAVLQGLLQGSGAISRAFAVRGLGVIKEMRAATPLLGIVAADAEPIAVRIEAARALAELGVQQAAPALIKIVSTPALDANLRLEAVNALGQINAPAATEVFIDLLTDRWPSIRAAALTGLARTDPDLFLSAISGLDPDPHWSVRAALARALGHLDLKRAMPRLTQLSNDADQRVIPAVLETLVALSAPEASSVLIEHLSGDDPVVRMAAASGLARLKSSQAVPALVSAYARAERDPTYVARAAILAALTDIDRAAASPVLAKALADRDWAIRVRAAALLSTMDPAVDLSAMRPAPPVPLAELNDMPALINPQVSPIAYIDTDRGVIQVELAVLDAPRTVANFISLARRNFLGATPFHRIVSNFVVQDGDPRGDGEGGPGYTVRDEINQRPFLRGTVGMALDWADTGGSQFFITHSPQPHLDGRYTVFGRVIAGIEVVDRLTQWDQIRSVRVWDGVSWIGGPTTMP